MRIRGITTAVVEANYGTIVRAESDEAEPGLDVVPRYARPGEPFFDDTRA
jgi:hypothetical protein